MRAYEDGESQRSARSKLGLFLEDMNFPAKNFEGSQLKNEELKQAKINDLRQRCNAFCKEFRERYENEGIEECQDTLMSYFDSLKQRASEGKLVGGTIKNRKFTVKRLVEKVIKIRDSKGNGIDWEELFNGLPKPSRFAKDRGYSIEEIRQICKYNDPRIKPIVYLFASSGIRLGAWDYLKWGHISPQERNGKIVCALVEVYKNTPDQYPTLITVEAYNALKEWMDFRERSGEIITPDSWIMRDYWDTEEGFTHGMVKEPVQLRSSGIKSLIDSALRRQGLRKNLINGHKRHDVQLDHGFRKLHETVLIKANLKLADVNILQGHANEGMIDHYYRPSADPNNRIDDYLINEFLKAEKYLTVEENHNISEIKTELDHYKNQFTEMRKEMRKEIVMIKLNSFVNEYLHGVQDQKRLLIESITNKNNGKLDRDIEGFVFRPEDQLKAYFESDEGKRLTLDDKSLLEEALKSGEIGKQGLLPITMSDYNNDYYNQPEYDDQGNRYFRI